jgi:hypothetical protein
MVKKKALKFWKRLTRREITEDYLSKNNNILIEHLISLIGSKSELKKLYVQIFKLGVRVPGSTSTALQPMSSFVGPSALWASNTWVFLYLRSI